MFMPNSPSGPPSSGPRSPMSVWIQSLPASSHQSPSGQAKVLSSASVPPVATDEFWALPAITNRSHVKLGRV